MVCNKKFVVNMQRFATINACNILAAENQQAIIVEGMRNLRRFVLIDEEGNINENAIIDMLENMY